MGWKDNKRPTDFIKVINSSSEKYIKKKVLFILQQVIIMSPVDSGAFRGNHRIGLNGMEATPSGVLDKSGEAALANGKTEIARLRIGDLIYIYNNLPYAVALENGHSDQAPLGIYAIAAQRSR